MTHGVLHAQMQQLGVLRRGLAQPALEQGRGIDAGWHSLVIEGVDGVLIHQDIAPPRLGLQVLDVGDQLAVMAPEGGAAVEIALGEGEADEDGPRLRRVDGPIVHPTLGHQGDAEQGHLLEGRDLAGGGLPVGLKIAALEQMAPGLLDPGRLDPGDDAPILARGLHPLRGDQPLGLLVVEARAGVDEEAAVTRPLVLAALVLETDVAEETSEQSQVEGGVALFLAAFLRDDRALFARRRAPR